MSEERTRADELLETAALSRSAAIQRGGGQGRQIIVFQAGGRAYAVPIEAVERTERISAVTPVPRVPDFVRGVASLRGGVVCVVALQRLLAGDTEGEEEELRSLVVVGDGERRVALQSTALPDFVRVLPEEELAPPAGSGEVYASAVERDGRLIGVLDLPRLFDLVEARLGEA